MDIRELPDLGGAPVVDGELYDEFVDPVFVYERDGTVVYVNPAGCTAASRARRDLLGRNIWQLYSHAEHEPFGKAFQRALETGTCQHLDQFHPRVGRWYATTFYPARGHIFVIARDVSAHRMATERLARLDSAARAFAEASGDPDHGLDAIARHLAESFGDFCTIQLVGDLGASFDRPIAVWDCDDACRGILRDAIAQRRPDEIGADKLARIEARMINDLDSRMLSERLAGRHNAHKIEPLGIHSVMLAPLRMSEQTLGMLRVGRRRARTPRPFSDPDFALLGELAQRISLVVARYRTQAALQRWRDAFEHAPWGITLATPDNRFIAVNRAFATMHGGEPSAWIGRSLLDMLADDAQAMFDTVIETAHRNGRVTYDSSHVRADGTPFPVRADVTVVKDPGGRVLYRVANFQQLAS